jgi:hypothetical protein
MTQDLAVPSQGWSVLRSLEEPRTAYQSELPFLPGGQRQMCTGRDRAVQRVVIVVLFHSRSGSLRASCDLMRIASMLHYEHHLSVHGSFQPGAADILVTCHDVAPADLVGPCFQEACLVRLRVRSLPGAWENGVHPVA